MKLSDFDYHLPAELIAQSPAQPRDFARLMLLDRSDGSLGHARFYELPDYLAPGDLLVINETRVLPARLHARKVPTGGKVELLLLKRKSSRQWEVLVGGRRVVRGTLLQIDPELQAEVIEDLGGARRLLKFSDALLSRIDELGEMPLPPYIRRPLGDPQRYQTIYAQTPGSAAAPTAGLHFTQRLLDRLLMHGVQFAKITLHIGLDTFAPVEVEKPEDHAIHTEWCRINSEAAALINRVRAAGGRIIAVGTTSVRALETAAHAAPNDGTIAPFEGSTDLFILPGYRFRIVDGLITNFHLPRSTLLMLVCAFAGLRPVLQAYDLAKRAGYRFYSFGDAMLIQ